MNNIDISIADSEETLDDHVVVRFDGSWYEVSHPLFDRDHQRRMALLAEEDRQVRWDDRVPLDAVAIGLLKKLLAA